MSMAIAYDVEFSEYLRKQAASCGANFAPVCTGGTPTKFSIEVDNLKYSWVAVPANKARVESIVAADLAMYFGVIKSKVTVTASAMADSDGTTLTSNMEVPSQEQSTTIRAKLDALAASRRTSDNTPAFGSLEALPPSAKNDPLVDMQTAVKNVVDGRTYLCIFVQLRGVSCLCVGVCNHDQRI